MLTNTVRDVVNNHTLSFAASLAYYFVLSLFPALIALAAIVGYLPIPDLWNKTLYLFSRFVPADSMGLVRQVLSDVITPNRGKLLSFGLVGTLWVSSSGFAAMIEALNVAYDVSETRPIWKTRGLALIMTFAIGSLLVLAVATMVVGPQFGAWLSDHIGGAHMLARAWPVIRWITSIVFIVAAVEGLYFLAPNVKQRFACSLPGAFIAVVGWLGLSYGLGFYFQNFANFNKTYGTLGAAIALMTWLYWSSLMILIGAEINSELLKASTGEQLPIKEEPEPESDFEERAA